jgi:hypothetical protein
MNYIKVGNKFFVADMSNEGKLTIREPNEKELEALEETAILGDGQISILSDIEKVINQSKTKFLEEVTSAVKDLAFKTLGFHKNYGSWEARSDSFRLSDLGKHLAAEANDVITKCGIDQYTLSLTEQDELAKAMKKEFLNEVKKISSELIKKRAQELANQQVANAVGELIGAANKTIAESVLRSLKAVEIKDISDEPAGSKKTKKKKTTVEVI